MTDPMTHYAKAVANGDSNTVDAMDRFNAFMQRRPVHQNPQTHKDIERVSVSTGMACQTISFKGGDDDQPSL